MINNKKVLAIIPARGASKGIPQKNIQPLNGKPLIAWTIEAAQSSQYIDRLILSSDDDVIIQVAKEYGCDVPFKRSEDLAQDKTSGVAPVLDALDKISGFDSVVVLQVTSPLRTGQDVDECLALFEQKQAKACVSVTESSVHPEWMFSVDNDGTMSPFVEKFLAYQRQSLSTLYGLNGAIYVADILWLQESRTFLSPETQAYVMPKERSIDIDEPIDLKIAGALLENKIAVA